MNPERFFPSVSTATCIALLMLAFSQDAKATTSEEADDGCANLASAIASHNVNVNPERTKKWMMRCNAHPKQEVCRETRVIIQKLGEPVPNGLVCDGKGDAATDGYVPYNAKRSQVADADNACVSIASAVVSDALAKHPTKTPEWIKRCSAHPIIETCQETIIIMKKSGKKPPVGLVCRGR